ncbi:MAG: UDP-N-acetylmuramate dehydrogenase [Bacteroidia bacterium]|nr:UDP-N-acetylmuramate dehydrogenase [Bacteroidia bacterium]
MKILENQSLASFNTFGLAARCDYYVRVGSEGELAAVLGDGFWQSKAQLVLGGGSNILLQGDFAGLVLHVDLRGREVVEETENEVLLALGAGEIWHESVMYAVEQGWGGIENLSLIPGRVGAAPMQNIGAYGVELEQVFAWLEAMEVKTGKIRRFSHAECGFGYRESVFKRELKGRFVITKVGLRLQKHPVLNTSYGAISQELALLDKSPENYSIRDVSEAVIRIHKQLPDPAKIGNAGSFFKNPVIAGAQFEALKQRYPGMPAYPAGPGQTKLAAGWLIDRAGWKGVRKGRFRGAQKTRPWCWSVQWCPRSQYSGPFVTRFRPIFWKNLGWSWNGK